MVAAEDVAERAIVDADVDGGEIDVVHVVEERLPSMVPFEEGFRGGSQNINWSASNAALTNRYR